MKSRANAGRPFGAGGALLSTTPGLEPLWRFLGSLWGEEGCYIDPNGRCRARVDEGCNIDPNGHCLPGSTTGAGSPVDTGCNIDPSGNCAGAATQVDTGCNIDPDGRCVS